MESVAWRSVFGSCAVVARALLGAAMVIALGSASYAGQVPGTAFKVGPWDGGAYADDNTGAFSHCAAGATYNSGIFFIISLSSDGATWGLGFMDPSWRLSQGQTYRVTFAIDRLWATDVNVTANDGNMVSSYTRNRAFMAALQAGRTLSVTTPSTRLAFNLTYSARVVNALQNCVSLRTVGNPFVRPDTPSSNPFGAPVKAQGQGPASNPKALAVGYLTSLLNGGEMGNFAVMPRQKVPADMRDDPLLWTNGSVTGGLLIVPSPTTLDDQQAAILAEDAKSCTKGSFASGSRTDPVFSSRRIFTACNDTGTVAISYSLIPLKAGGALELFDGARSADEAQQADDLFFRRLTSGKAN